MKYDSQKHNRKSIRLPGHNYSQEGHYFVTICTEKRRLFFGKIENEKMVLNKLGAIIKQEWLKTPKIRKNVKLDEFIIMSNHIHGIIIINDQSTCVGAYCNTPRRNTPKNKNNNDRAYCNTPLRSPSHTLGAIIRGFKSTTTKQINLQFGYNYFAWQRNYYEHIIKDEESLYNIRRYIIDNPKNWQTDRNNPDNF
ncbi:MAG: transposase [Candidatus Kuenenbacteria bacterium]